MAKAGRLRHGHRVGQVGGVLLRVEHLLGRDGRVPERGVHGLLASPVQQRLHERQAVRIGKELEGLHERRDRVWRRREGRRLLLQLRDLGAGQEPARPGVRRIDGVALREGDGRRKGLIGALIGQRVLLGEVEPLVVQRVGQLVGEHVALVRRRVRRSRIDQPVAERVVEAHHLGVVVRQERVAERRAGRQGAHRDPRLGPALQLLRRQCLLNQALQDLSDPLLGNGFRVHRVGPLEPPDLGDLLGDRLHRSPQRGRGRGRRRLVRLGVLAESAARPERRRRPRRDGRAARGRPLGRTRPGRARRPQGGQRHQGRKQAPAHGSRGSSRGVRLAGMHSATMVSTTAAPDR